MDWFLYDNGLRHERVKETKRLKSLIEESIAELYLEPKRASTMKLFCEYT